MAEKIQVFHFIPGFRFGGIEARTMELYKHMNKERFQYNFVTYAKEEYAAFDVIRRDGGKVFRIAPFGAKTFFRHCADLKTMFTENKVDVAHCYSPQSGLIFLHYAKKYGVKRRIMHARTSSFEGGANIRIKELVRKLSTQEANTYLAVSKKAGDWLFDGRAYTVIPNAIDIEKYKFSKACRESIRDQYGLGNAFVIGHIGRNTYAKNHEFLIEVFSELLKVNSNARLMLVGFGREAENIVELCNQYGVIDKTVFCGFQENTAPFYSAMDLMVFPSLYEGLPGTLLEAQACGLRCIASDSITDEVALTPDLQFMSLQEAPKTWAEKAMDSSNYVRQNNSERIYSKGYSLEVASDILAKLYLQGE